MIKKKKQKSNNNLSPLTQLQSAETSGEHLKGECVTQLPTPSQKVIFLPVSHKNLPSLEHAGERKDSSAGIPLTGTIPKKLGRYVRHK